VPGSKSQRSFRIGVAGLPAASSEILSGRLYALACEDHGLALSCMAGTVAQALRDKREAVILTDAAPEALLEALAAHELDAAAQVRSGRLRLYRWRELEYGLRLPDVDIQFIDELDYFRVPRGALLLVDPADVLLTQGDSSWLMTQVETYRNWARGMEAALLLLLRNPPGALARLGESGKAGLGFSGFAQLRRVGRKAQWETGFWRSGGATLVSPPQDLDLDAQGRMAVTQDPRRSGERESMAQAADRDLVYCTEQAVAGARSLPAGWRTTVDLDAMLGLDPAPRAATCVLHAGDSQNFRNLAQTVHGLRLRNGRMLRILVIERGVRLRSVQERLLLSIGANMVVFGDADVTRIGNLTQALQGQWYQREIPADFAKALAAALPPPQMGYLPPQEFSAAVLDGLARAGNLGLDSMLLRFRAAPGVSPAEVVHGCYLSRNGDLVTIDEQDIHLFLYACSPRDVDLVLGRVFPQLPGQLFASELRLDRAEDIIEAANALAAGTGAPHPADADADAAGLSLPAAPAPPAPPRQPARGLTPAPLPLRRAGS
jgi:cellulose biosynthesis protein BcsE